MSEQKQNPPGSKRPPLAETDRNFDDLAPRFARNIYGANKGRLRMAVLTRDLSEQLPALVNTEGEKGGRILDAGGGQGQFSRQFASRHELTLCDISSAMLAQAEAHMAGLPVRFLHQSIQNLAAQAQHAGRYDLVLCHAVLEWVVDQRALLRALHALVAARGYLSLTFYNAHGLAFKNLLRGRRPKILSGDFRPHRGSLTPTRPLDPDEVLQWLREDGWDVCCHSGIRVFSDYQLTPDGQAMSDDARLELELQLSRREPYRSLGRYQHLLLKKSG